MGIILKHTFKNVFKKPGRTFLLTLCIFLCTLAAAVSLDMTQSVERIFANAFGDVVGSTDITLGAYEQLGDELSEALPPNNTLLLAGSTTYFYRRDPQLYTYAVKTNVGIMIADLEQAHSMNVFAFKSELGENETIITRQLGELLGYSVGDTIEYYDWHGDKVEYVIKEFCELGGMVNMPYTAVLSPEGGKRLFRGGKIAYYEAFIDITDNSRIGEACDILKEKYPDAEIMNITDNEELQSAIDQISQIFMLYFAVCLLVVVIINMTVSERIISERMAVVGTLRSLGVSQGKTTAILLLENIIYALLGSVPGIAVYLLIRPAMFTSMFTVDGMLTVDFGNMSVALQLGIIAGAIILECACTLKEVLKASRTAIRDIIFMNKDTEFRFSRGKTVFGLICLGAALVTLLIPRSFASMMLCFIGTVIGIFILFPYVTVFFSRLLGKLFDKAGMPVAKLAAAELGSKKSTIASTQLIAAASSIMVLLFVVADSMLAMTTHKNYDCDLIISGIGEEDFMFDYIDDLEGVCETENLYCAMYIAAEFNGSADKNLCIYGFDGMKLFTGISGLPEAIAEDEFWMDKALAQRHGLNIGDTVELKLNSDSFAPRTLTLKLGGFCDSALYDGFGKGVVLNKSRYLSVFSDMPLNILIKTDGTNDEALIDKIGKYSSGTMRQIQTVEELNAENEKESHAENQVIKLVGALGILMTFVGVASNQLIGFESRKRECAVLLSTSLEKRQLRKMLLLETVLSALSSLVCALPIGLFCVYPVTEIMIQFELALPLVIKGAELALLVAVLTAVFSLTVLFPFKNLRKMKLAEQLKYE